MNKIAQCTGPEKRMEELEKLGRKQEEQPAKLKDLKRQEELMQEPKEELKSKQNEQTKELENLKRK